MTGARFGRLTVESEIRAGGYTKWNCLCDCGRRKAIRRCHVTAGTTKSCGCLRSEFMMEKQRRHGAYRSKCKRGSVTAEYRTWRGIKDRCTRPGATGYERYGGRGIYVCPRWLADYWNFLMDMGHRPSDRHSIERVDNDGPYAPWNCKWATAKEQGQNRSTNRVRP